MIEPPAHVVITTPAYDRRVDVGYAKCLIGTLQTLSAAGCHARWDFQTGAALVHMARNVAVGQFLADEAATHLLMIDSDIMWPPADVLRLLGHQHDIVCGAYRGRIVTHPSFVAYPLLEQGRPIWDNATGCFQLDWVGAGFMLFRRRVFEHLIARFPERRITKAWPASWEAKLVEAGLLYDLFPTVLIEGFLCTEDLGFCKLLKTADIKIWCDPKVILKHVGWHEFAADPMSMLP